MKSFESVGTICLKGEITLFIKYVKLHIDFLKMNLLNMFLNLIIF